MKGEKTLSDQVPEDPALSRRLPEVPLVPKPAYTQDQLMEAMRLVENKENWKLPVDCVVPADSDRDLIFQAVIYFTGSIPSFTPVKDGFRVQATGYYAEIGS